MRTGEIRRTYLEFFRERGHRIFPSVPLVPEDPRAPLLTTAGMVPFIPYFYAEKKLDPPRAASCQVVARTTDIEIVGLDARHQSVYEMLGNFSFGDYFKEDAVRWAWELSVDGFGLDPDRIWVTVYREDDETYAIWRDVVGLPEERIVWRGKEDNFWWMGVPGPGGPNTELYYDRGPAFGDVEGFQDGDRIMEYWNLVFTQFSVDAHGDPVSELPQRNVDTGAGVERLAQILQEVPTAYETDAFRPILARAEEATGRRYGADERADVSLRIIAEHARASAFMVGDGILPSNEDRGYVLRRILRRAVRHAKILGIDEPVLPAVCGAVVDSMGEAYPSLVANRSFINEVVSAEEDGFRGTLRRGLALLDAEVGRARSAGSNSLAGAVAFTLHDTYGFPFELTLEIAAEAGLQVDREAFEREMDAQRDRAREARRTDFRDEEALRALLSERGPSAFAGYDRLEDEAKVLGIVRGTDRVGSAREGDEVEVVLDATPFYPEGGGQVGDRGVLETAGARLDVTDTQRRLGDLIVHSARVLAGELSEGDAARAAVDPALRAATERSHTATHILHATLRAALGDQARQAGSLVAPGRLRFDFPHGRAVPREVLEEVEARVNARLATDDLVKPYETTMDEARDRGAMMLFEEKYGDIVRVVEIGDYSIELCGGTHVRHTSQVGVVKILGEGSIGSNVRRVEALTGAEAIADFRRQRAVLERIAALLATTPEEAPARVQRMLDELRVAQAEIRKSQQAGHRERARELAGTAERIGGTAVVVAEVPGLAPNELQKLAAAVRDAVGGPAAVVLASVEDGRAWIAAALDPGTLGRGVAAAALISEAAKAIGGGAGGRDDTASGGGRNPRGLPDALRLARAKAEELLGP